LLDGSTIGKIRAKMGCANVWRTRWRCRSRGRWSAATMGIKGVRCSGEERMGWGTSYMEGNSSAMLGPM
jgi:hypothetical protein